MAAKSKPGEIKLRDRIIGLERVRAGDLVPNKKNWRRHTDEQRTALRGILEKVGYAAALIAYRKGKKLVLIDGHLRAEDDPEQIVPVLILDVTAKEADLLLTALDPLAAMAVADTGALSELLAGLGGKNELEELLGNLPDVGEALEALSADAPGAGDVPRLSLVERFLIPPFSILDARQGYWQARKKKWLALGIRSELGRGETLLMSAEEVTEPGLEFYRKRKGKKIIPGGGNGPNGAYLVKGETGLKTNAEHRKIAKVSPGANPRPAMKIGQDGKSRRGDGAGREIDTSRKAADKRSNLTGAAKKPDWATGTGTENMATGTSIFDPVLAEICYRWFSPPGGVILDPFAGGSVRGIVAGMSGRGYVGIDLREEQTAANNQQWDAVANLSDEAIVKISAKSMRQMFMPCEPSYIQNYCHAKCCYSSTKSSGTLITIHPSEEKRITALGVEIKDHLLMPSPGEKKCPFIDTDSLCSLHDSGDKPFGCIASPFTLNNNGTLIVRNRYRLLKCYRDDGDDKLPAYKNYRASLDMIFGDAEASRICEELDDNCGDIMAVISRDNYSKLIDNDNYKTGVHGSKISKVGNMIRPRWIVGDAIDSDTIAPGEYDFIFTCPPYYDLEVYSDDERDLSNMPYDLFLNAYRTIIAKAVLMLKDNRFAAIVVGDIRDKSGIYRNFVSETIAAFQDAGAMLYNEAILITAVGSLPIRAGRIFEAGRKLGKTHQNVLVFVKGDPKKATAACGPVDVYIPEDEETEDDAETDSSND